MTDYAAVQLEDLPESLREIIELIGMPATLSLVGRWGGVRLYIPERIRPDHVLAQTLGVDNARALSEIFARCEINVPKCDAALRRIRDREIRRLHFEDGWPAHRLARHYHLTERQVYTILAQSDASPDDGQSSLF